MDKNAPESYKKFTQDVIDVLCDYAAKHRSPFAPKTKEPINNIIAANINTIMDYFRTPRAIPTVVKLADFSTFGDKYDDFVYVRDMGLVFFNVSYVTSHEIFLSVIGTFLDIVKMGKIEYGFGTDQDYSEGQDRFLENQHGMFLSSIGHYVVKDENFSLNAQEKMAFRNFQFITPR